MTSGETSTLDERVAARDKRVSERDERVASRDKRVKEREDRLARLGKGTTWGIPAQKDDMAVAPSATSTTDTPAKGKMPEAPPKAEAKTATKVGALATQAYYHEKEQLAHAARLARMVPSGTSATDTPAKGGKAAKPAQKPM